jgi:hypothetical protein
MGFDQRGNWTNDGRSGIYNPAEAQPGPQTNSGGYFDENGMPPAPMDDFWNNLDQGVYTNPGTQQPRLMNQFQPHALPGPMTNSGGSSIDDLTNYFRQAGPADGDPAYWASVAAEKIGKGANVQDTLSYLTGRADFKTLGGDGRPSGGAMGNYTPLGQFSYNPQKFSNFSAASVNAPEAFKYQGPSLTKPNEFTFPGVYRQQPPQTPQAQPAQAPAAPAVNPHGVEENGMVRLSNGALVPTNHPLAAEYNAWQPPAAAPAAVEGPQMGTGVWTGEDQARADAPQVQSGLTTAESQTPQDFSFGPLADAPQYGQAAPFNYGAVPTPERYTSAQPFNYGAVQAPEAYQAAQPFSYRDVTAPEKFQSGQPFGSFNQSGQIDAGTPFQHEALADAQAYNPTAFTATTTADLQSDPGYQERVRTALQALEQSAAANGTLFSTGTSEKLMERAQQIASQEFANVDSRRYRDFTTGEGMRRDAAGFNEATRQGVQGIQYGQARDTYGLNQSADMAAQQGTFANAATGYGLNQGTAAMNEDQLLRAAQFNTSAEAEAQGRGYGQAANTAQMNEANRLGAYQTNTQTQAEAQARGFGQAATTADMNERNRLNAANFNATTSAEAQARGYSQAADSARMNEANRMGAAAFNEGNRQNIYGQNYQTAMGTFGANQQAQNQRFGQALQQDQYNTGNTAAYQQRAFDQQYQPWAQHANNSLQAGSINASSANQTNALNASQEQNRYQAAWQDYLSQVSQAQFGAGMGLNYAQLGLQQQGQNFNQGLAAYNTNYQTQVADPWNRNYQLAALGQNATQDTGQAGFQYGNLYGQGVTGIGNAQAAGQVGAANAQNNMYANLANTGMSALAYSQLLADQASRTGQFAPYQLQGN